MKKKFNLDHQYELYLKMVGLKESDMIEIQKKETKQAFVGGIGQLLIILQNDFSELTDEEGYEVLESLLNQVSTFFNPLGIKFK